MNPTQFALDGARAFGAGTGADVPLLLFDAALKSFLLLAVALVVAWLLRRRSATSVHRMWTLFFVGCLVTPLVTRLVPAWDLPLVPRSLLKAPQITEVVLVPIAETAGHGRAADRASGNVSTHSAVPTVVPSPSGAPKGTESVPSRVEQADVSAGATSGSVAPLANSPQTKDPASEFSWIGAGLVIWVGGVFFFLLRRGWQHVALARLLRRSTVLDDETWTREIADASHALGVHRTVRLLRLDEGRSPLNAGLLRPVIVLPGDADRWDPARRHLVLLHEQAHVKRHDVLTQAIAGFVCALYWFNPVAWFGLFQMRKLRELACDDLVLACGERPADYASVLLEVARTYRHRNFATAVGMVRRTNVEGRIRAVLDKARSRGSLSRRAASTLLASVVAVVVLIASARLQSNEVPTSPAFDAATANAVSRNPRADQRGGAGRTIAVAKNDKDKGREVPIVVDAMRRMKVHVRDEGGKPIEGARVHVSTWYLEDYDGERVPRNFRTNADGVASLRVPRRLRILRLWAAKAGFVPEFVNFAKGTHDEGKQIPDRFAFELARGTELSGRVVDERGDPIAGVEVEVRVDASSPAWTVNPKPITSTWLTVKDFTEFPVTDLNGNWKISNAPEPADGQDHRFRLKLTHQNYVSDARWGELQTAQGVTTTMLRDGSATVVLSRGAPVVGTVVDAAGEPVTEGLVIWHDRPYRGTSVHETQIDNRGRFQTDPLSPGEHPFTVVAPGHQPERRVVAVAKSMEELRFTVQPGKRLTLKIVDQHGDPIPNAFVGIRNWRGAESLYNHKHPNVPDSRIPRQADEQGIYVWDWAPDDAVTYQVSQEGFSSTTVALRAKEEAHSIKLVERLVADGRVTDATTGKAVRKFRAVPVTVFRPKFLSTSFRGAVPGQNGNYEIELTDRGEQDYRYRVRIEADGYRSAMSPESYGLGDGPVQVDFALEPAPARQGRVVDHTGAPVAAATVVEGTPSTVPVMRNGELKRSGRSTETSTDGSFQSAATFEPVRFRVTHESGFAEVLRQPEEEIGTIQLEPWARVSGRLLPDGKPIPGETIFFSPVVKGALGEPRFQDSYRSKTDADGRFEFERLPPIAGNVRAYLGPWRDSPLTSSQAVPLDLKPGEHRSLSLGGDGIALDGKVVATGRGEAELNKNWSLNYLIRRDRGIDLPEGFPKLSFDPAGPVEPSRFLDPNRYRWLATRQNYFVKLTPGGALHVSGVPAGVYDLVLQLYEQPTDGLVETAGEKVVPIEITESDVASGAKDLGVIEVECRAGPRPGESMGAYKFFDTAGRERSIREMKGRYVLVHVWASWCAPCLESMPEIRATVEALSSRPITFVGLNVDKEVSRGQALAERGGWSWSQNYVGADSNVARQLAISSVPTYFLVGPEGRLAASATDWSEMKEEIETALKGNRD